MDKTQNHQLILIVFLSFIIGFITSFILFAFGGEEWSQPQKFFSQGPRGPFEVVKVNAPSKIEETEEGLFLNDNGERHLISLLTAEEEASVLGTHVAIFAVNKSMDGKYVHYCAQKSKASNECQHLVYSKDENKNYPLKNIQGDIITSSNNGLLLSSWGAGKDIHTLNVDFGKTSPDSYWVVEYPTGPVLYPS